MRFTERPNRQNRFDNGSVAGREQYDAYGAVRQQAGAQLPFTYTGEQQDPESGLAYLRSRSMEPASGRFLSRDAAPGVASHPRTLHRYA